MRPFVTKERFDPLSRKALFGGGGNGRQVRPY
jgi:hypothetical protein